MPSLHVMGRGDPFLPRSRELEELYSPAGRASVLHEEGHNIPSLRTGAYPQLREWILAR